MRIIRLDVAGLRRFERVSLSPGPRLNLFTGDNGAGKTSVLEALHLLAYGRSFRGRVRDGLIRDGAPTLSVYAEWEEAGGRVRRAGLQHDGRTWQGRLDGSSLGHLGELCAAFAVVTFEPGSHVLVTGGSEPRRRLLDWGLFHVEPAFLPLWRHYARALKQRNALLKMRAPASQFEPWEKQLAESGEMLTGYRQRYLEQWQPLVEATAAALLPAVGRTGLQFQPGWRREELSLADALLLARERDLALGHGTVGPHRADWRLEYAALPGREALSRGQAKLSALASLLAQAQLHAQQRGEWPALALDDLGSELDRIHQRRVLDWVEGAGAQVWVTGTEAPAGLDPGAPVTRFHVEQGRVEAEAGPPSGA